jgi:aryl-alcohol dehydrogenase-like predicted oxidoreductase
MRTKRIGSLEVSEIGLGTNSFGTEFFGTATDQAGAAAVVHAALDAGITFFDTAEEYSTRSNWGSDGHSEAFLGAALGKRRNEVVIASKFMVPSQIPGTSAKGYRRIMSAVEGSLRRLGTDRIDLYQQHFADPDTPIDEHIEALDRLVKDGKVREIGHSNFSGAMIDEAAAVSEARGFPHFVTTQTRYNLLDGPRHEGVIEACERHGLKLLPYYPLSSGVLTGKYAKGRDIAGTRFGTPTRVSERLKPAQLTDERVAKADRLDGFARDHGHSLLELALSWLVCQPFVGPVMAGATSPEQVRANAAAANWRLSAADFSEVARIVAEPVEAQG